MTSMGLWDSWVATRDRGFDWIDENIFGIHKQVPTGPMPGGAVPSEGLRRVTQACVASDAEGGSVTYPNGEMVGLPPEALLCTYPERPSRLSSEPSEVDLDPAEVKAGLAALRGE